MELDRGIGVLTVAVIVSSLYHWRLIREECSTIFVKTSDECEEWDSRTNLPVSLTP